MSPAAPSSATSPTLVGDRSLESIRAEFPILSREVKGAPLSYLDNGATAQKPARVIEAVDEYYRLHNSNVHRGSHTLSAEATGLYEGARARVAGLLGAKPREIVFTRNVTAAINLAAQSWGADNLGPGDRIVLTELEHHSNIVPWHLIARRTGAELDWIGIDDEGRLDREALTAAIARGPKVVTVTHVSNVLGTVLPVAEIVAEARAAGAMTLIDGAQAAPRMPVNVKEIGADFYGFTGHKLYGPTGIGVLYGKAELLERMPPFLGGGDMISTVSFEKTEWARVPHKFEAGTPPILEGIGLKAAIEWVERIGFPAMEAHERALTDHALARLSAIEGVTVIGRAQDRGGVVSFTLDRAHAHDVATLLDRQGIAVRAGHHCAEPLMHRFGLDSTARASFAAYTTRSEIDALAEALARVRTFFR